MLKRISNGLGARNGQVPHTHARCESQLSLKLRRCGMATGLNILSRPCFIFRHAHRADVVATAADAGGRSSQTWLIPAYR